MAIWGCFLKIEYVQKVIDITLNVKMPTERALFIFQIQVNEKL